MIAPVVLIDLPLLLTGVKSVSRSQTLAAGFSDQSHLARHFRERAGMPPSAFRWLRS